MDTHTLKDGYAAAFMSSNISNISNAFQVHKALLGS